MSSAKVEMEICVGADDLSDMAEDLRQARNGGAHRIELCAQMQQQGVTPTLDAIIRARDLLPQQTLMVMLRPREGNFVYSEHEHQQCLDLISQIKAAGADGVVLGPLSATGEVHTQQLASLVKLAKSESLSVTFHRAFDAVSNRQNAWLVLSEMGVNRVLSSGTPWESSAAAVQGVEALGALKNQSYAPELVVGGGVSIENARSLISSLIEQHPRLSLHAYSGVMNAGRVSALKVRALVEVCEMF